VFAPSFVGLTRSLEGLIFSWRSWLDGSDCEVSLLVMILGRVVYWSRTLVSHAYEIAVVNVVIPVPVEVPLE
jgi:hypothetical protein